MERNSLAIEPNKTKGVVEQKEHRNISPVALQCMGCEHAAYCRFVDAPTNMYEDGTCIHFYPSKSIDQRRMERVYGEVEKHGGIYYLVGLDRAAVEGRLLILPESCSVPDYLWKLCGAPNEFSPADCECLLAKVRCLMEIIRNLPETTPSDIIKDEIEGTLPEDWRETLLLACQTLMSSAKHRISVH